MRIVVNIGVADMIHSLSRMMAVFNRIVTHSVMNGGFVSPSSVTDDRIMSHRVRRSH